MQCRGFVDASLLKQLQITSCALLVCQPPFLIKTQLPTAWAPGKKFGDAADDWQFWHGKIPAVLQKWHERGYKVAIISNQMGIGTGKADKQTVRCGTAQHATAWYAVRWYTVN